MLVSVMVLFALAMIPFGFIDTFHSDEGVILNGAWKMFNGQRLYTDFFSFIAPGSYVWTWLSFHLLGPTYLSARMFGIVLLLASIYAVYGIALEITGERLVAFLSGWGWAFASFVLPVVVNHNSYSSYIASVASYYLIVALIKRRAVYFLIAGLFTGGVVFFLQTKGIVLSVGVLLFLMWCVDRGRIRSYHVLLYLAGVVVLPTIAVTVWTPSLLYRYLIEWPSSHYLAVNRVSLLPLILFIATFALAYYSVVVLKQNRLRYPECIALVQVLMVVSILTRPDIHHLWVNSFMMIILCAYVAYRYGLEEVIIRSSTLRKVFMVSISFLLIMFPASHAATAIPLERQTRAELASYNIQSLYAHPFLPGYYFELGLEDPYPFYLLLTGFNTPQQFDEQLRVLQQHQPSHIFVNYTMVERFGFDIHNPVDAYIWEHYKKIGMANGNTITVLAKK